MPSFEKIPADDIKNLVKAERQRARKKAAAKRRGRAPKTTATTPATPAPSSAEATPLTSMPETPPKRRGRPPKQPVYTIEPAGDAIASPALFELPAETGPGKGKTARGKAGAGKKAADNGGNLEAKLWTAADKQRGHMDAAEYKHVVLGLIFLKYISDAFDERFEQLRLLSENPASDYFVTDPGLREGVLEDRDEYSAENAFWVPKEARWSYLQGKAKQPTIGQLVDDAMLAIEQANPSLKGVLAKDYARPALDKRLLGELIDLIGTIGLGDAQSRSKDILGRVYEYFLGRFAEAEGKRGGQFYTPQPVVQVLVAMLEPYQGRIYDPCCGSGGMFVSSQKFVEAHGGKRKHISVYGQESNPTTWRLCKMNLAIRNIENNIGSHAADSFLSDQHKDLKADFILANPPFNMSDWGGQQLAQDVRWLYGAPPANNANFAWVQHMIHHLAPRGRAGFVLANGSMSSNTSGEGDIRRAIVEADLVDCMVAMPGQLFYTTQIPVCLWFLSRTKLARVTPDGRLMRDHRGETLFIDARQMGGLVDRTHRELTEDDVARIANTYHAWLGEPEAGVYQDVPGFCHSAKLDEIQGHGHVLTPGRYVGAADVEDDGEEFERKMQQLTGTLWQQMEKAAKLNDTIVVSLTELGYGR